MPQTQVVFYQEEDGSVPILEWFERLPEKVLDKCRVKLERLRDLGHELRRPEADYLRESGGVIMPKKRPATGDAIEITHRRYYEGKPDRIATLEEARADDEVARKIYQLRTEAGLSQRELAKLVGTTASVVCRLENADYEGHSLPMLRRIAAALDRRVEIRFIPLRRKSS